MESSNKKSAVNRPTERGPKIKRENELEEQFLLVRQYINTFLTIREMKRPKAENAARDYGVNYEDVAWLQEFDPGYLSGLSDKLFRLGRPFGRFFGVATVDKRKIDKSVAENPELFKLYLDIIRRIFKIEKEKIHALFEKALEGKTEDIVFKKDMAERTLSLGEVLSSEQKELLRKNFPSGNYLLHTTGVNEALMVIDSGLILSSLEISKRMNASWGRGGFEGISFNTNDVRVLNGDTNHFMGFLVDPLFALNDNTKLSVPDSAAKFELQLVPRSYYRGRVRRAIYSGTAEPWQENPYFKEEMPRVNVCDTFILCNAADVNYIKRVLAVNGIKPRGIITYPNQEIRVKSWVEPTGDHEVAAEFINRAMEESGIERSIDWSQDLFPSLPNIKNDSFVSEKDIARSGTIIKKGKDLFIVDSNGQERLVERPKARAAIV